mmetsp:Transcript_11282/g.18991  ORF Transcript_11282/g.18991 Transcript_11282/m.18991 type:complete len:99 (-) Transcript_11282:55-351(-)|eukprot:CAMPEP_0168625102 /NCGR_PEP_ID=MMETSP0449_2-20121227/9809_1 /TAXON_ID=1082188 /ORGANISM="Strombidium rassoulzadegani, Strain ras09" /LENGTH=98 /DNA_ID=CAMNT_0008666787 /DNA_START=235 /DNA_END=528 /DNA_ORIENTATION=-
MGEMRAKTQQKLNIPAHLLCPISDDLMEEPVQLSSGFTYEKATINKHFEYNGMNDPMTREDVDGKMTINQSIKTATEDFIRENPWAFEFGFYDDLDQI